jgi:hypothetical protein
MGEKIILGSGEKIFSGFPGRKTCLENLSLS